MKLHFSIFLMLTAFSAFSRADSPPEWLSYSVMSPNGFYRADISQEKSIQTPKKVKQFILQVFRISAAGDSLVWECRFDHDGYPGGVLSEDGTVFAKAARWFREKEPVVSVFSAGRKLKEYRGSDLPVTPSDRARTVSHELWLKRFTSYELVYNEGKPAALSLKLQSGRVMQVVF